MKRFLNKKTIKIFMFLLFVGISFSFFKPQAKTKLEYYKELFGKEFGFKIFEPNKNKVSKKDYLSSNLNKGYSVILSSTISPFPKKTILICDSDFSTEYPFKFSCSSDSVSSNEAYDMGGFLRSSDPTSADLYVVPEQILLTSEDRSDIGNIFKAIIRTDKGLENFDDTVVSDLNPSILSRIKEFKDTTVFEFFSIAFYMLIIASLSWGFLSYLCKEDRKFNTSVFKDILNSFKNLQLYQKIIIPILFLMISVYISLILFIGLKDGNGLNIGYVISYTKETFSFTGLTKFVDAKSIVRLGLFAYGVVIVGILFIFLLPQLVKVLTRAQQKISQVKVKTEVIRYSLPCLIILSLVASSFFGIENSVKFLIFTLITLVFLFVKNLQRQVFDYIYSAKEKLIFITIAIFIILAGFLFNFRSKGDSFDYKEEDLIGVTDEVVLLPYSKQLGENTLMNEYNFSGSEPVFVDNYLVYTPNNSRIENKNAKEFKNEGVFYIQNGDLEDIVSAINSNESLSGELRSEEPSNFFRIKNFGKEIGGSEPEIQITFSCKRQDLGMDKIKVDYYYFEEGEVLHDNKTLLYFPGCSKIDEPETYKVKLDTPFTESEFLFMRLVNVLKSDIEEIKIIHGDQVYAPEYFSKGRGYEIIDSGGLTNSAIVPVTNYIFGDSYGLGFEMTLNEEDKFDMSVPINELIKEGKLKDRFLIWSIKKYLPVRE